MPGFFALPLLLKAAVIKGAAYGAWKAIQSHMDIVDQGSDLKTEMKRTLHDEKEPEGDEPEVNAPDDPFL